MYTVYILFEAMS